MQDILKRNNCRLCNSKDLALVLALTPTPPANAFVAKEKLGVKQTCYPLDIYFCNSCAHVQLLDVVNPEILFRDYVYVSGTSPVFVRHFENYANSLISKYGVQQKGLVVDIGSNDGTLLRFFKQHGYNVLGIDPAVNIALKATQEGIETWSDYFTPLLAEKMAGTRGKADFITANNVFAHIDDLRSVGEGVKLLLADKGVFSFEVSYLLDVYEKTLFDTIYHEHLCYHSVRPLIDFFDSLGLCLFDVQRIDTHGGSLRGFVCHKGAHKVTNNVADLMLNEAGVGLYNAETFKAYGSKINNIKSELTGLLRDIKNKGGKIAGYGAPAKATTLMYHFGLDGSVIDFIVDDSPLKAGMYSPGLHIPVVTSDEMYKQKPEYIVVLAWNFADSIIKNHNAFLEKGGKFIVPLPTVNII